MASRRRGALAGAHDVDDIDQDAYASADAAGRRQDAGADARPDAGTYAGAGAEESHGPGRSSHEAMAAGDEACSDEHARQLPPPAHRFDERVNASDYYETQAYTSLVQVGPREALVTYQRFWGGSTLYPKPPCCSTGYGMRIAV